MGEFQLKRDFGDNVRGDILGAEVLALGIIGIKCKYSNLYRTPQKITPPTSYLYTSTYKDGLQLGPVN